MNNDLWGEVKKMKDEKEMKHTITYGIENTLFQRSSDGEVTLLDEYEAPIVAIEDYHGLYYATANGEVFTDKGKCDFRLDENEKLRDLATYDNTLFALSEVTIPTGVKHIIGASEIEMRYYAYALYDVVGNKKVDYRLTHDSPLSHRPGELGLFAANSLIISSENAVSVDFMGDAREVLGRVSDHPVLYVENNTIRALKASFSDNEYALKAQKVDDNLFVRTREGWKDEIHRLYVGDGKEFQLLHEQKHKAAYFLAKAPMHVSRD